MAAYLPSGKSGKNEKALVRSGAWAGGLNAEIRCGIRKSREEGGGATSGIKKQTS